LRIWLCLGRCWGRSLPYRELYVLSIYLFIFVFVSISAISPVACYIIMNFVELSMTAAIAFGRQRPHANSIPSHFLIHLTPEAQRLTHTSILVPTIPGLPTPGQSSSFPTLEHIISLKSFHISTVASPSPSPPTPHDPHSPSDPHDPSAPPTDPPTPLPRTYLSIEAKANLLNPIPALGNGTSLPYFNFTVPSLPFIIAIPLSPNSTLDNNGNGKGGQEEED
jgi:hypothetical protein